MKYSGKSLRPTYAFIDLGNLENNIKIIREKSNSDIMAIVKANGYGHGAAQISVHAYKNCGVNNFGVATLQEGFSLRAAFNSNVPRIIVLGYVDKVYYDEVVNDNIVLTIFDYEYADSYHKYLESKNIVAPVVLKIDTGMNRLGFGIDLDFNEFISKYKRFKIVHVMSHFSSSDSDSDYSELQINSFDEFLSKCAFRNFDTSLFNSSGIGRYSNKYTLTRPGLIMYGYVQGVSIKNLKPVMSIKSKIVHIKRLHKFDSMSYNRTYIAPREMLVGVVPIGYADGYRWSLSNKGVMYINGIPCDVLGRVCMDMTMIDISAVGEGAYGCEVEIMGDHVTASDIAKDSGTMEYEILCGISDRIPRIYSSEVK